MKLVRGQAIMPVPWPIQSRPTASASKPTIRSDLRMDVLPLARLLLAGIAVVVTAAEPSRHATVAFDRS
jgi:hypothetical protein